MSHFGDDGTTIDFNNLPTVFRVGDRVHLLTTQIMPQTTGTVVATEYNPDQVSNPPPFSLGVTVRWDNDGSISHLNNIALELLGSKIDSAEG